MKKTQNGIALIESLLIILILVIVGFGGYYVWHSRKTTTTPSPAAVIKAKPTASNTPDITADWLLYNDPNGFYSLKVADGWNLTRPSDTSSYLIGGWPQDIAYQKGKLAAVTTVVGGRDGPVSFDLHVAGKEGSSAASPVGEKQTGFETAQGIKVDKYVYTQTTEPEGPGIAKGGKSYQYVISKGSTTIVVGHDESPGDPDNVAMVEQVVKTIKL